MASQKQQMKRGGTRTTSGSVFIVILVAIAIWYFQADGTPNSTSESSKVQEPAQNEAQIAATEPSSPDAPDSNITTSPRPDKELASKGTTSVGQSGQSHTANSEPNKSIEPANTPSPLPEVVPTATAQRQPTPTPSIIPRAGPVGMRTIQMEQLPFEAVETIKLIWQNGPFPFDKDDTTFGNREGLLPDKEYDYYREFTVITPGLSHRGARRIVEGAEGELYYTEDHYESFYWVIFE